MKRLVFAGLWTFLLTFVFLVFCCVVAGIASAITLKGDAAQNKAAIDEASREWAAPMFFGSLLAAVALSAWGVLPGTRRRAAAPSEPGEPADPDFPPVQPTIAVPLGTPEDPPPELAALGPPLQVHESGRVASMSGAARFATFVLGLVLFFAPIVLTHTVDDGQIPQSARKVLVISSVVASLMCLVIAVVPRNPYSYQVHRDALVVSDRKTMHIILWDQIQALNPAIPIFKDHIVVTYDGQELPIKTSVRDYHQLVGTVIERLREYLLPRLLAKVHSGGMAEFGPLGVSSHALRYKGKVVPWDEVTKMLILNGSGFHKLMIYRQSGLGLWAFCQLNLNSVPNDLMLLEVLKQIAPSRLLVTEQASRSW